MFAKPIKQLAVLLMGNEELERGSIGAVDLDRGLDTSADGSAVQQIGAATCLEC